MMARVSAPAKISEARKVEPAATPASPARRGRSPRKAAHTPPMGAGAAGADPEQKTDSASATSATGPQQPAGRKVAARPAAPPLPEGVPGEKRITLPLWHSLWRALRLANVDDGIDTTVRIRSMIELWEHDPRLRARVDKLARDRAASLSRGRPRTRS